jgi:phosphoribosylformimino-5-aminoimidazole carboxamide ribotide isomerase
VILLPAIDVRDGRAVRLVQGDYDRETAFDADPLDAARRWVDQGAEALHVVDLDGAREGAPVNLEQTLRICASVSVPVQLGGGLRDADDVAAAFEAGAARVVLGTAALSDPALLEALAHEHGQRIAVAADVRGERVAIEGWERESAIGAAELVGDLAKRGVRRFVYTPVDVDGTLAGPRIAGLRAVAEAAAAHDAELTYSGGIGELDHLRTLAAEQLPALTGVIVGRALYERRFTVDEGRAALRAAAPPV